jgi:hypothetical protein
MTVTIESPQVTVGAVILGSAGSSQLARVFDIVVSAGAEPTGWVDIISLAHIPRFELLSDLVNITQTVHVRAPSANDWERTLRVWLSHPAAGAITVGYGAARRGRHPVTVVLGGAGWAEPRLDENDSGDDPRRREVRTFVDRVFHTILTGLDPLYASIQVEDSVPSPDDLDEERASIGSLFFLSGRVVAVEPDLVGKLTETFAPDTVRVRAEGVFVDDSTLLNPARPAVLNARRKGVAAARLLARAIARMALD